MTASSFQVSSSRDNITVFDRMTPESEAPAPRVLLRPSPPSHRLKDPIEIVKSCIRTLYQNWRDNIFDPGAKRFQLSYNEFEQLERGLEADNTLSRFSATCLKYGTMFLSHKHKHTTNYL